MNPLKIYQKLYKHFGPQGWWPIFDKKAGRCEYRGGKNLSASQKFEICVGAILTQNTAWKNVERALANLHRVCHPERAGRAEGCGLTPQFILSRRSLAALIRPAGYYNQKAKKLKIFSREYLAGNIFNRQKLLALWGIGPETADSMLLYASKRPIFVVDSYTKRLCSLFGIKFAKYDDYRGFFENSLPRSVKLYNEFHALIVAWGKMHSNKKTREAAIKLIN